jgi:hypothetical protein
LPLPNPKRTIVHQPRFDRELEEICSTPQRAEIAIQALEWTLCRHPEWGLAVPNRPQFLSWPLTTDEAVYKVIYRWDSRDDDRVYLLTLFRVVRSTFGGEGS